MIKLTNYIVLIFTIFVLASCETDVDLRADYDDTPIVFGILDQSVDTQFIKINRSFIGEGDNFQYAAIADCTIFKNVKASIKEVGGANREFELQELYVKDIDDGIFYEDSQKVYFFSTISSTGALDEEATYELSIDIDEGRKTVTSETTIVGEFSVNTKEIGEELKFAEEDPQTGGFLYNELEPLVWQANGKDLLYSASLRFYYTEYDMFGSSELRFIEIPMGTIESKFSGDDLRLSITGEKFFDRIKENSRLLNVDLDLIDKRVISHIEFVMAVADPTLKIYIDLNKPSTGVVQERPSFTNINGGRGVFASRNSVIIDKSRLGGKIYLNKASIEELFNAGLKFCSDELKYSPTGADPQGFYCP